MFRGSASRRRPWRQSLRICVTRQSRVTSIIIEKIAILHRAWIFEAQLLAACLIVFYVTDADWGAPTNAAVHCTGTWNCHSLAAFLWRRQSLIKYPQAAGYARGTSQRYSRPESRSSIRGRKSRRVSPDSAMNLCKTGGFQQTNWSRAYNLQLRKF